jgi:hypothetical protein
MDKIGIRPRLTLTDCGSASTRTRGLSFGFFLEAAPAPFNWTIYF